MLIRLIGYVAVAIGSLFGAIAFLGWIWWTVPSGKAVAMVLASVGVGLVLLGSMCIARPNKQ